MAKGIPSEPSSAHAALHDLTAAVSFAQCLRVRSATFMDPSSMHRKPKIVGCMMLVVFKYAKTMLKQNCSSLNAAVLSLASTHYCKTMLYRKSRAGRLQITYNLRNGKRVACNHGVTDARGRLVSTKEA